MNPQYRLLDRDGILTLQMSNGLLVNGEVEWVSIPTQFQARNTKNTRYTRHTENKALAEESASQNENASELISIKEWYTSHPGYEVLKVRSENEFDPYQEYCRESIERILALEDISDEKVLDLTITTFAEERPNVSKEKLEVSAKVLIEHSRIAVPKIFYNYIEKAFPPPPGRAFKSGGGKYIFLKPYGSAGRGVRLTVADATVQVRIPGNVVDEEGVYGWDEIFWSEGLSYFLEAQSKYNKLLGLEVESE